MCHGRKPEKKVYNYRHKDAIPYTKTVRRAKRREIDEDYAASFNSCKNFELVNYSFQTFKTLSKWQKKKKQRRTFRRTTSK